LYDPTKGNLLLDVRNFSGGTATFLDAQITQGDSISRVLSDWPGSTVSSSTGTADTIGLVTQFTFGAASVVPEPPTGTLIGVGAAAGCGLALDPPRRREESRVGDHPVGRPHAQPVDVPRAHQDLDRLDHREGARGPQRFDRLSDLGDRGDVAQEDSARDQRGGRVPDHTPRLG